jgi:hypothetical protein
MWTCSHCSATSPSDASICEVCSRPRERPAEAPAVREPDVELRDDAAVRRPWRVWVSAAAVVALGLLGVTRLLRPDTDDVTSRSAETEITEPEIIPEFAGTESADPGATFNGDTTTAPTYPTESPSATDTASGGLVSIDSTVTDPRAPGVADVLATYFDGINRKDYDAVAGVLDPAGAIDPSKPSHMESLAEGTRSTHDSDIVLGSLTDAKVGRLKAGVNFRSEQAPGDGPLRAPEETCTRWSLVYTITVTPDGTYLIRGGKGSSVPC